MYRKNNINFRILSSDVLQRFKKRQFLVFNELYSKKYDFLETSKEILLLQYDQIFNFILYVETLFLRSYTNISKNIEAIKIQFEKTSQNTINCIRSNTDTFLPEIAETWIAVNELDVKFIEEMLNDYIKNKKSDSILDNFDFLGKLILEYMSNLLYTIHEIDYLVKNQDNISIENEIPPFLSFTNFAYMYDSFHENKQNYIYEKIKLYEKRFSNNFVIVALKIYSDNDKGYIGVVDFLSKNTIIVDEVI
ncbi:MAG: hypothetical protein IPH62_19610 [Ignavibacteriae bacterium]|nr:hypothetical protein [Ignavibacteriota bacterium]